MKKETVIAIIESLAAECTRRFSEKEIALKIRNWETKLEDLMDEQGWSGLSKMLDTKMEYMPSVGTFKEVCLSGLGGRSLEDDAHQGWVLVIANLNSWISPVFKDSLIAEAIRKMGGWKRLCLMLQTEEPFRKRDFIDLYLVAKRQNRDFSPVLSGVCVDYKFIGYSKGDDLKKVVLEIERKKNADKRILAIVMAGEK